MNIQSQSKQWETNSRGPAFVRSCVLGAPVTISYPVAAGLRFMLRTEKRTLTNDLPAPTRSTIDWQQTESLVIITQPCSKCWIKSETFVACVRRVQRRFASSTVCQQAITHSVPYNAYIEKYVNSIASDGSMCWSWASYTREGGIRFTWLFVRTKYERSSSEREGSCFMLTKVFLRRNVYYIYVTDEQN